MGGIGHNQGPPLEPGRSWRRYCWARARAALVPPAPLEVVKRRMARARELGLSYPAYASIITITGRDLRAYLVTTTALGRADGPVRPGAASRFGQILRCDLILLGTPGGVGPDRARAALGSLVSDMRQVGAVAPRAPLPAGRDAILALLAPLKLPADTVAMIGDRPIERDWAEAARLAKFLPADHWFDGGREPPVRP